MRRLHSNSNGFTLIEMLVVVAILGAIMGAMAMTINFMLLNHDIGSDRNIAIRQVEQAGYFISRDIQMAGSVNTTVSGKVMQIMVYSQNGTPQSIDYILDGSSRDLVRYADGVLNYNVAKYIDAVTPVQVISGNSTYYTVTITSTYNNITEQGILNAQQRAPQ